MKRRARSIRRRGALVIALLLAACIPLTALGGGAGRAVGAGPRQLTKRQTRILSGFASLELRRGGTQTQTLASQTAPAALSCPTNHGSDVVVNQNCLNIADSDLQGRGQAQAQTAIAAGPNGRLVASYTDYRGGEGACGLDTGKAGTGWSDVALPTNFVRGADFGGVQREYFQASGDTSVAWDTRGNAYLGCLMYQRGPGATNNSDSSSGIYLYRSTGNLGASWNFTGRPVAQQFASPSAAPLLDKSYMTVDNHPGSPFRDRIYVTWTKFDVDGSARIYEAYSRDYGESFSSPVLVSSGSSLCPQSFTASGGCDENQFAEPFVSPTGALYVVFVNFNNAVTSSADNHNQILLAKSRDGGATFGPPVKVADYYALPDCSTYQGGQDPGRACVPEKGSSARSVFQADNYPSGAVNPAKPRQVVITFGSYINRHSRPANGCTPAGFASDGENLYTGVKTPGACNNKILYSVSSDRGTTFTGATKDPAALPVVNQGQGQRRTDQFWQRATFNSSGRLAVSYYDRQYAKDESKGSSDISLSASSGLVTFKTKRVTTSPMHAPTEFTDPQGHGLFYGDYSGLAVVGSRAYPLWTDTRSPDLRQCPGTGVAGVPPRVCTFSEPGGAPANDQNIYTRGLALP